ncbi:hypothetical protein NEF87_004218 [Candidatus Lokiarchaeum ossiferum]|uniref:sulfopyruvate decarboxylase n=1 Tax=Candidatus Lokiarchaeum ossiferum TaxID=2951803 RepID=A0ABY6HWM9_9ARCH|nr:hypothetical protein NEF87_004218 [Candidatus Lokiarchaeum sp. B-35]
MNPHEMWNIFQKKGLDFFTGVPDSTFKSWMSFLDDMNGKVLQNVIAANECEALAIASGYHLATKKCGIVYMQNSGLGKTVNPITSLADPEVYSIPLLMLIGWRGEPGKKDEPQHKKMGRITIPLLDTLEIRHTIFPDNPKDLELELSKALTYIKEKNSPFAFIIKKNTLDPYKSQKTKEPKSNFSREEAIQAIISQLEGQEVIISTTGKTSRELFETRISRREDPRDFYTVGSMGCASAIGLGIALNSKKKTVILDGDGAMIMQMGSLATIGHYKPSNYYHFLFDNNVHDSTGGQPTVSDTIKLEKLAEACGYASVITISDKEKLSETVKKVFLKPGPAMIIVKVKPGARADLGRPTTTPIENKQYFMNYLEELNK